MLITESQVTVDHLRQWKSENLHDSHFMIEDKQRYSSTATKKSYQKQHNMSMLAYGNCFGRTKTKPSNLSFHAVGKCHLYSVLQELHYTTEFQKWFKYLVLSTANMFLEGTINGNGNGNRYGNGNKWKWEQERKWEWERESSIKAQRWI